MTTNENPNTSPDAEVNAWFAETSVKQEPNASPAAEAPVESKEQIPADAKPQPDGSPVTAAPVKSNKHLPSDAEPPISREKRKIAPLEQILLPIALVIGILYDRLIFATFVGDADDTFFKLNAIFWLCYLVAFYAFFWKKIAKNRILWYIAGCTAALCIWNFIFSGYRVRYHTGVGQHEMYAANNEYTILAFLVIPCVLMAHAQFSAGGYRLKNAGTIAFTWLLGWVIKPFSGLPAFVEVIASLFSGGKSSTAKKAALGVGIVVPLLCVILPLLAGADKVFGFYLAQIAGDFNIGSLIAHCLIALAAFTLFYSFLWNVGFGKKEKVFEPVSAKIDAVICCIVLGSITLLYVLFCAVQFTYLFTGAGLPADMTYSEYAREGFAQTVAICALNLLIFGIFLQFGNRCKIVSGFLAALLGLTGIMLFSGFMRLRLYIDAYGLTWLRLLSAWFIVYLAVVIIICAVRMMREKLPAIALCALILLGWYTVLGYANPDAFVTRYNQSHNYGTIEPGR